MRVLVTRPAKFSEGLCQKIQQLGAYPESFPVIEFKPTAEALALQTVINKLNTFDIAIFASRASVEFSIPQIMLRWPNPSELNVVWAAIGPGTRDALLQGGIKSVILPKAPPYESESLLDLEVFQSVVGKKILIVRGNGGREFLRDTLKKRGAEVEVIQAYRRVLPTVDMVERLTRWHKAPIDVIVTTSAECLQNLLTLVGTQDNQLLKDTPLIVVGLRMLELANKLDFKRPILASGADDASILEALTILKGKSS